MRIQSFVIAATLIFCLSCARQFGAQSITNDGLMGSTPSINLEMTPMTSPLSTQIVVSEDGTAKAWRYSRYQLVVSSLWAGRLPTDLQTRLAQRIYEIGVADACKGENVGSGRLTRGDQFQLLVALAGRTKRRCFGFIDNAPMSVRQLLGDLEGLPERLPRATVADAYVRSEVLPPERLESIRRAGQMRFVSLATVARELQPILDDSIRRPLEFVSLSHQQYEALRSLIAPAHDFVLTAGESGYQLTLFQAQPAPSSKGRKQ